MSLKDASEKIKRRAKEMRDEVKGTVGGLGDSLPRPLMERRTIILREPILRIISRRIRERK